MDRPSAFASRSDGRAQQQRRPAPRLAVEASPHFSPQQLPPAGTRCQPLCSLVTPVEEVRWCRLPFHKQWRHLFSPRGPRHVVPMGHGVAPQNASQERAGKWFWFFTRIGKVSPPHSPADSWKTVERGTLKVTERLCDDRDSIAHRRREAQDPSPRTRLDSQLTLPPQTLRRHACVYKRGWPPTCPATQPTQPTTPPLAPHKRSNQAQLPKAHPPPRAPLAHAEAVVGNQLVPDGVMQAVSLPMVTHLTAQLLTAPSRSLVWAVRRINMPPADSPMAKPGLARLMQPLRADCSVVD